MTVSRIKLLGIALAIFAVSVWLYWPSVHGEFLALASDDLEYLRQSERWNGLTWNAVTWAFTCTDDYYQPLVRLSHVLDYQIWGTNAAGHHATSVFLHALNAALVFGFLWTLLGATSLTTGERLMLVLWVAVVFAIHPLQVESVAWISGRTQLLCTTFGITGLWAYAGGARRWAVWGLFVAALLCKPMAVSFPFVMLAMDYFPLRRQEQLGWGRLLREKALMIVLAGVVGVATVITKSRQGDITALSAGAPLSLRVFLMSESLMFYPLKLVWPAHLSPSYPIPWGLSLSQWPVSASVLGVVMITAAVVMERRRMAMLAAAWAAYVVLVLPVSGLVVTGAQSVEQRHAYVAMLPLLLLAGGAGVWLWRRLPTVARVVMVGLVAGQLGVFAGRVRGLIPDWHNDETIRRAAVVALPDSEEANRLFAMALLDQGKASEALPYAQRDVEIAPQLGLAHITLGRVLGRLGRLQEAAAQDDQARRMSPDSAEAHVNFGVAMMDLGKVPEAAEHFEQALRMNPNYAAAHNDLGNVLARMGKIEEAITHFEQALRITPDYAEAHYNLGNALAETGKIEEAIAHFEQALRINPDYAVAHNNLGNALARTGKIEEAITHFEQALRITPDDFEPHYNYGVALENAGRVPEAIVQYRQALRINPDYAEAHCNLGTALHQTGKPEEAIEHYQQALRIKPDYAEAYANLGLALARTGKIEEAIAHYEQALRIKPDYAEVHYNLGNVLLQKGCFSDAIAHYEQALRIKPDDAEAHYNLGNVFLRKRRFSDAIGHYEQALQLNPDYAEAHNDLGTALAQTDKINEAIAQFEQALRIKPDYAEAHGNLGNALAQVGRVPEAIVQYEQALRIKPDLAHAQDALARLQARP